MGGRAILYDLQVLQRMILPAGRTTKMIEILTLLIFHRNPGRRAAGFGSNSVINSRGSHSFLHRWHLGNATAGLGKRSDLLHGYRSLLLSRCYNYLWRRNWLRWLQLLAGVPTQGNIGLLNSRYLLWQLLYRVPMQGRVYKFGRRFWQLRRCPTCTPVCGYVHRYGSRLRSWQLKGAPVQRFVHMLGNGLNRCNRLRLW